MFGVAGTLTKASKQAQNQGKVGYRLYMRDNDNSASFLPSSPLDITLMRGMRWWWIETIDWRGIDEGSGYVFLLALVSVVWMTNIWFFASSPTQSLQKGLRQVVCGLRRLHDNLQHNRFANDTRALHSCSHWESSLSAVDHHLILHRRSRFHFNFQPFPNFSSMYAGRLPHNHRVVHEPITLSLESLGQLKQFTITRRIVDIFMRQRTRKNNAVFWFYLDHLGLTSVNLKTKKWLRLAMFPHSNTFSIL